MKVYDVLTESKQVDEGPIRFLKRTLGKNTASGKAAQLDVELDKEVSNIYKDFVAVSKQDPKMGGMTAKGLANFLKAKGFVSKPSAVMGYINQEPSLGRKAAKAGKKVAKGAKAAAGAAKSGASKVGQAASKLKQKLTPEPTGLTPGQADLPLQGGKMNSSIYSEAVLAEVDMKLSSGQAKKIIKRFVQQGFQKQMGSRVSKSSYGDADKGSDAQAKPTAKPKGDAGADDAGGAGDSKAVAKLRKAAAQLGYKIVKIQPTKKVGQFFSLYLNSLLLYH